MSAFQDASSIPVGVNWYVVHTHAQRESLANQHLRNQSIETVYLKQQYRTPTRHWRERPYWSRYLFAQCQPLQLGKVRNTKGVYRILTTGADPLTVPPWIIDDIRALADPSGYVGGQLREPGQLAPGDPIRVTLGSLYDRTGTLITQRGRWAWIKVEGGRQIQVNKADVELLLV